MRFLTTHRRVLVTAATVTFAATALLAGSGMGVAAAASTTPVTVWLAGDSTVANSSSGGIVGWGGKFKPYFNASVTVNNQAVAGRSIQTWLYEGNVSSTKNSAGECSLSSTAYSSRWTSMQSSFKSGDWLIVQFGINDGDPACPRHVGSARYQQLLGVMAKAAQAKGVHVIFNTPVAAITCSGSTAVGNRGFLTDTKTAANANGVPVIDLHALSLNLYNQLKLCPNNSDYTSTTSAVGKFFANDHTHFSADGAPQIAGLVARATRDQGLGLSAWLN